MPERELTVFYGCPEVPRLSHYFLPRVLLQQKRVLYLDGANQISPHLIAKFARERNIERDVFNKLVRVSRPFTCFQFTKMIRKVPEYLKSFPASVVMVTAFPDLFFDEDAREREARASFEQALEGLQNLAPLSLTIAVFSDATSFKTKRRDFFPRLRKQANHIIRAENSADSKPTFTREYPTSFLQ